MNSQRILVCLYSDANFLALSILESLLSKNTYVVVVTREVDRWGETTVHLKRNPHFSVASLDNVANLPNFNYSIFCGGFVFKNEGYGVFREFITVKNIEGSKRLAIFPFEIFSPGEDRFINASDDLSVIYVGDLLGPRIDSDSDLLMNRTINQIFVKKEVSFSTGEVFYPVFVGDVARAVTKWLFSFGPYGKKILLTGPPMSGTIFGAANQKIINNVKIKYHPRGRLRSLPRNIEKQILSVNLKFALLETYKWLIRTPPQQRGVEKQKEKRKYPKYLLPLILVSLLIFTFPLLAIGLSFGVLYFSYKDFMGGGVEAGTNKIFVARTLFAVGQRASDILTYIPGPGGVYRETGFISYVGKKSMDAAREAVPLIRITNETFNNILGDSVYDPSVASQEISVEMDRLYQNISSMQAQVIDAQKSNVWSAKYLLSKVSFDRVKNYFRQGKVLATNLPSILGKDKRRTYLILFQNNMELRPTGGFIGSFGLLTFDGGRMTDLTVNDVYSADGQLRGHVEPPIPIRYYLNEANWWLRDSNWDPDFQISAKRAEWFLDKEVNTQVDGVFAVDLKTVSEMLKVTGPIFLADYNLDITSDNLYQKTQAEAQGEFFPGSRKKASFLTALSRNLIGEVEGLGEKQKLLVLGVFLKGFDERHMQAFLHENVSQNAISSLGWGGEVVAPTCGDGCYADLVGLVEANLGVNKANYFISRNVDLTIGVDQAVVIRKLTLTINNSANLALGPPGTYKAYIRTFLPSDSSLISAKAITGESIESLSAEVVESRGRQEAGVFTQVLGGQSKKIEFTWTTKPQSAPILSSYGLYIRKQAGVGDDPWHITIDSGNPALTKPGVYTYNTVLTRDFFLRIGK